MSLFKPAVKDTVKLRLALMGPAGSGKTMSALRLARGLVGPQGKIAVIDTENGSASLYAGKVSDELDGALPIVFDTARMSAPFLVDKYLMAINAAVDAGYDCVIVDSLSHAWDGEGGILSRKEAVDAAKPSGNTYVTWGPFTKEQNALVTAILQSKTHIICTMRSKTEYVMTENMRGKMVPTKVGLEPIQRKGVEYEFDVCLDVAITHIATPTKDRTGILGGEPLKVTEVTGARLKAWLTNEDTAAPIVEEALGRNEHALG